MMAKLFGSVTQVKMKIEAGEPVAIIGVSADITDEEERKEKVRNYI